LSPTIFAVEVRTDRILAMVRIERPPQASDSVTGSQAMDLVTLGKAVAENRVGENVAEASTLTGVDQRRTPRPQTSVYNGLEDVYN
jgi:hypothetical protein